MSARWLLGLDVGSGGGRCLVIDAETGEHTSAFRPWSFGTPESGALDLERLWTELCAATRQALEQADARPDEVAGIAASGVRFGAVVLGGDDQVVFAASNRDARAVAEAIRLGAEDGESIAKLTGHWPMPLLAAPRLLWLREHEPDLFRSARAFLSISDWVTWRLSGAVATDPTQAGASGLFDLARGDWAAGLLERLDLPPHLFPAPRPCGSTLGALGREAARDLGIESGVPVAVGGADTQLGLLGCGAIRPAQLTVIGGTTAPVEQVLSELAVDPHGRLWSSCHAVPGQFVRESNAGALGEALDAMGALLAPGAASPTAALMGLAAHSEPGAGGVTSTYGVQIHNGRELSLATGSVTLSHLAASGAGGREHVARAIAEGACFGLRANLEQLTDPNDTVLLGGGLSRSAVFAQLLADVLDAPVGASHTAETSALGAAICAGIAAGFYEEVAAGAEELTGCSRVHEPDASRAVAYKELYGNWRRLLDARSESEAIPTEAAIRALLRSEAASTPRASSGSRPKILVTAALDEEALDALRELGDVEYASFRDKMRLLTGATLAEALDGVQVFITEVDVVDLDAAQACPDLRVVASCRGDAVNVDVPAMKAHGIPVLNAPGRNAEAVADLALAFLLMLARKLPEATGFLREPGIEPGDMGRMGQAFGSLQGRELWRKTVGLVGLGAVGARVAQRLTPFGARVLAFDPFQTPEEASLLGADSVSLERLLAESDFVSLHAPVNEHTEGMIGAGELARMKPGACLVNTARAALVDEVALHDALERGGLGGAALDVFAVEPPGSEHPLLQLDSVIATPHVGGNTVEVAAHQGRIIADDLARLLRGDAPRHALNAETAVDFDLSQSRRTPTELELAELRESASGPAVSDLQRDVGERRTRSSTPAPTASDAPAEIVAAVEKLMGAFTRGFAGDSALRDAAEGQDVTLHFALSDLPCQCWLRLRDGDVSAGVGAPDVDAEVQLRMRAYIFDGMFTGAVNAMEKAMSGELSFTGDTAKAMTLQQIQRELNRLYRAARAETGDPGDLAALPDPVGARPSAPAESASATGDVRAQIVSVVNELYATQLITATGGNVSALVPDENVLWITPSQMFKGDLAPEILVRIDADTGQPLDPGAASPSSERLMHCAAYRARKEARAVIHCHAPNATILVNSGLPFLPISTEAAFFADLPRIPFTMPGTADLADAIERALDESWAVLMQNHGILVSGRSLRRAADMAEIIERTAEIIVGCYAVGREPPVLPPDVVEQLRSMGDLVA